MVSFHRLHIYWPYLWLINATNFEYNTSIPVLVISAEEDSFYGGKSPIYKQRNEIIDPNCTFVLMDGEKIRNCIWSMMWMS